MEALVWVCVVGFFGRSFALRVWVVEGAGEAGEMIQESESHDGKRGGVSNAISNMMVRLLSEYTGRGPTRARTYMQDDLITVVLRDTLTKAELRLARTGQMDHVRETRRLFQDAMREDIVAGIEGLTGRRVLAFLSDNHIDPDLAVETIILEPSDTERRPETGGSDLPL
ncbi:MAG TPA: DUF2294 domain-containing protein [Solirubrobacteraceae bacterium]|nr:DUF2294 domain-containing protein [Solirubrobacteraceae bacterium]